MKLVKGQCLLYIYVPVYSHVKLFEVCPLRQCCVNPSGGASVITNNFLHSVSPRFMTACCVMDYNTVATADKFGNICIVSITLLSLRFILDRCNVLAVHKPTVCVIVMTLHVD